MSESAEVAADLTGLARESGSEPRVSRMAAALIGSEILKIAAEIRRLKAQGRAVCDLTVGDFSPRQFPIPERLASALRAALDAGETNYPPSTGIPALREAVRRLFARELGLEYPLESVLIAGGSRPIIYCLYVALCDPGDRVVYPVPSWNNNHYVHLVGAEGVPIRCAPERNFLPGRAELEKALRGARLLALNSPLNPSGTVISREALREIAEAVLAENERRDGSGERPLFLMYDQVYWMLTFGGSEHVTPPALVPELARYTVFVDGISKAFAATGLRVGWGVGPVDVMARMSALLGHVGAWAPRAEQVATAALLEDPEAIAEFRAGFLHAVDARLALLHEGLQRMRAAGLPVDSVPPMGAIYLTSRIHPFGRRTPQGATLGSNEQIRRYVLEAAGIGIVPFQAFGATGEDGWFRLSVGAVGEDDVRHALPRLEAALAALA